MTVVAGHRSCPSGRGEPGSGVNRAPLLLDVMPDDAGRGAAAGCGEAGRGPEVPVHDVPVHLAGEPRSRLPGRPALEAVHQCGDGHFGPVIGKQVHVIVLAVEVPQLRAEARAGLPRRVLAALEHARAGHAAPVRRRKEQMDVERGNDVPATAVVLRDCQRPVACCGVVQVRYRYRIYPGPGQQQALARVFGCARVVYNDCLRLRDACYVAGEKISDTQVQRRVITLAKCTPERAWLAGVASVALVQACQDARRAYRNWFDSLSGRRKGRRVGHPEPRRKHRRQSIRLTRNGFALHGETRLDHAHKTALRLVRDNQAVYAEDLAVSGLMRTKLARSVADGGWSLLLRCVEEKAAQYGRTFARIGRFEPTSQMCSACGVKDGPKPLSVRKWACGTVHDRHVNAARNILAAGRADNSNAGAAGVRPHLAAVGAEAGTHRSAV